MYKKITLLFRDRIISRSVTAAFLADIGCLILAAWKWQKLPPQVPLFYSLPRGEEQLGTPWFLAAVPLISLLLLLIHTLIAAIMYHHLTLAARLVMITGAIISIVLAITFVHILFLIT